jgi:hypothetical protein
MRTVIKGNRGETLGYLTEQEHRVIISDATNSTLGYYVKNQDKTFDHAGRFVGYGNQLTRLLKD